MTSRNWLLPDYIHDLLPAEAAHVENLRASVLALFRNAGFELVIPPMIEFTDSLLLDESADLSARTFKMVDQLSGRSMGLRTDMTPQITRIDAHLLNREEVTRLCYCGPVLLTRPDNASQGRELLQIGAEIYGYEGHEADVQIIDLALQTLAICGIKDALLDLNYPAVTAALLKEHPWLQENRHAIYAMLKRKDAAALAECLQSAPETLPHALREALLALPDLYGGADLTERARQALPALPDITKALDELDTLRSVFPDAHIDLADVSGLNFHSGIRFAVYDDSAHGVLLRGGRYDHMSQAYGRQRPATGFSLDLRQFVRHAPQTVRQRAVLAPACSDPALPALIHELRAQGEVVLQMLPGERAPADLNIDRELVEQGGHWTVRAKS